VSAFTPEQLTITLDRLKRIRHRIMLTAEKPEPDASLVPLLNASAECCALDNAIRLLERELKAVAS
jgi:hypothetical protein